MLLDMQLFLESSPGVRGQGLRATLHALKRRWGSPLSVQDIQCINMGTQLSEYVAYDTWLMCSDLHVIEVMGQTNYGYRSRLDVSFGLSAAVMCAMCSQLVSP